MTDKLEEELDALVDEVGKQEREVGKEQGILSASEYVLELSLNAFKKGEDKEAIRLRHLALEIKCLHQASSTPKLAWSNLNEWIEKNLTGDK